MARDGLGDREESPKLRSQDGFCEMEILFSPMILKIDPDCVRGVRAGG